MDESDKLMTDWEFPWVTINMETHDMLCNVCSIHGKQKTHSAGLNV